LTFQLISIEDEPSPTAAELRRRGLLNLLNAEAAEAALKPMRDCTGGLTAPTGLHAIQKNVCSKPARHC
jgi:hypothetical protein